jgi:hypothetical protein
LLVLDRVLQFLLTFFKFFCLMLELLPLVLIVAIEDLPDLNLMGVAKSERQLHGLGDILVALRVGSEEEVEGGVLEVVVDDLRDGGVEANGLPFLCP